MLYTAAQNGKYEKGEIVMERSAFGERLLALLHEQHLNQKQLSQKVGITEAAMSHYIKGDRVPRSTTLAKIAAELGTSSDYLMGGASIPSTEGFSEARRLIARSVKQMTLSEKKELINILLSDEE